MIKSKPPIFTGIATALVTPFRNEAVDFSSIEKLIEMQIDSGVGALVVCGTTGEAPTLSAEEQSDIIAFTVKQVRGRVPVIAGSGSNCTKKAVELSIKAEAMGADALLIVTPYYNKASSEGLIRHYLAIADSVSIPIILYNVPSRTGVDIPIEVYETLCKHKNIVGLKEARGNTETVKQLKLKCPSLQIYSGNDIALCDMFDEGALGCISVSSNIIPKEMIKLCNFYFSGEYDAARAFENHLNDFYEAMFCEVNPIPIKYSLNLMGLCDGSMRLPLCSPSDENSAKIKSALKKFGLI